MARHLMFSGKSPISGVLNSPRFLDLGQPLPEDGKTQLVSNNVRVPAAPRRHAPGARGHGLRQRRLLRGAVGRPEH